MSASAGRPTVFIQANARQLLGAKISAHSYKRASSRPDSFDVRIIEARDYPRLLAPGQTILRGGKLCPWDPDDLQSFTPLRFAPPSRMGFAGRALVTDPDCFAVGDVAELLERDMAGNAIMAVARPGDGRRRDYIASSVMLLDCAKLSHWRFAEQLEGLFEQRFDYLEWIDLKLEDRATIGLLGPEWNDFDRLTPATRILHTTKRRTQPWKAGLPIDFTPGNHGALDFIRRWRRRHYQPHPDPNQEALVFSLLADLVDGGAIGAEELEREMADSHLRRDSLDLIGRWRGWRPFELKDQAGGEPRARRG